MVVEKLLSGMLLLILLCGSNAYGRLADNYPPREIKTDRPELHNFRHVTGLTWGNGQYVAVGLNELVMTSANGKEWTTRHWESKPTLGATSTLLSVAWNGKQYLAVGGHGASLLSSNARTWHRIANSLFKNWRLGHVRAVNGVFYVMAQAHRQDSPTAVSSDTAIFSSSDGIDWQQLKTPVGDIVDAVDGEGGVLFLSRNGSVHRLSGNGKWEEYATPKVGGQSAGTAKELVGNGSSYVALIGLGLHSALVTFGDGKHSHVCYCHGCYHVAWTGKNFVASGSFGIMLSKDGEVWEPWSFEGRSAGQRETFNKISGHDGETLLIGGSINPLLISSLDNDWEMVTHDSHLPALDKAENYEFRSVLLHRADGVIESEPPAIKVSTAPSTLIEGYIVSGIVLVLLALLQRAIARLYPEALLPWLIGFVNFIVVLRAMYWLQSGSNLPPLEVLLVFPLATLSLIGFLVFGLIHAARTR